jgi:hypothetical protein
MLPPEILLWIWETVYYKSSGKVDYATLCNCSLVCRDWHDAVQSLLTKQVVLRRKVPTHLLQHGSNIRVLVITIGEANNSISPSVFADIFNSCPRLYELDLSFGKELNCLNDDVMQSLSVSPPPFRAFRLRGAEWGSQTMVPFQLLRLTSSIRHLTIDHNFQVVTTPAEPIKHILYELHVFDYCPVENLSWLLSQSVGSLQILETWWHSQLYETGILNAHAPHIRSLRYYTYNLSPLASFGPTCVNLEELMLYFDDIPCQSNIHSESGSCLPPTLTHLILVKLPSNIIIQFNLIWDNMANIILRMIETHPNLRYLTCDNRFARSVDFPKWKASCAERTIDIVCYSYDEDRDVSWTFDSSPHLISFTGEVRDYDARRQTIS